MTFETMTDARRLYLVLLADLRDGRTRHGWKPEDDREILAQMMDMFETMTDDEQRIENARGAASWPDLVDTHTEENDHEE